jgi:LmbE family N-acetylglucosaminyl deacetylase
MSESILVVAAHPDDEILGCGGTAARHAGAGDEVNVVIMAEGITGRDADRDRDRRAGDLAKLADAARTASGILGVKELVLDEFPDNRMDSVPRIDIIKAVEASVARFGPDIVYTHHAGDVNIDHRCIHDAVVTACRPMPGKTKPHSILCFEVQSSTEWQPPGSAVPFVPNWFVDISRTLDRKVEALEAYASEMRPWPHARSIEAAVHLARWRGASIGVEAAEAFVLGRRLRLQPE